jgi:hypothetical protein
MAWLITCKDFSVNADLFSFVLTGATSIHTGLPEKQIQRAISLLTLHCSEEQKQTSNH